VPPAIGINLSLSELKSGRELVRGVDATIKKWGLRPGQIEFDVTEAALAQVTWTQNTVLSELQQLGVGIAIDDFGSEYSSFDYLRAYRVNHIKIARNFIDRALSDPAQAVTVRAIIHLARDLGIAVITEQIDTEEQRNLLIAIGSGQPEGSCFSAALNGAGSGELPPPEEAATSRHALSARSAAEAVARRRDRRTR